MRGRAQFKDRNEIEAKPYIRALIEFAVCAEGKVSSGRSKCDKVAQFPLLQASIKSRSSGWLLHLYPVPESLNERAGSCRCSTPRARLSRRLRLSREGTIGMLLNSFLLGAEA